MTLRSVRLRLAVAGVASILVALVAAFFVLSMLFERHVERRISGELLLHMDQIIAGVGLDGEGRLQLARPALDPRFERPLSGLYWQIETPSGRLRSRSLWDGVLALADLPPGGVYSRTMTGPGGTPLLVAEREVVTSERLGEQRLHVAVAVDRADIAAATAQFERDLLPYLQVLALLLVLASFVQIAVGLRPLSALTARLSMIRTGKADRLGNDFPDEVLPLTREVDALLQSREDALRKARERAADLAHGFKTPLQILSGDVMRLRQRGEDDMARDLETVIARMRRHVDHELAKARRAGADQAARSEVGRVVGQVLAVVSRTPAGVALSWEQDIEPDLHVRVDAGDLAEIVGNLTENAARYAASRVRVLARRDVGEAVVEICDDGPGIRSEKIEHVLARGGRLDEDSGGAGLGLAIVRDVVADAQGSFFLENADPGLVARIRLPLVP